jgi:hypothetical protein
LKADEKSVSQHQNQNSMVNRGKHEAERLGMQDEEYKV